MWPFLLAASFHKKICTNSRTSWAGWKNEYFCRDELQQQAAQTSPNCRLQEPAFAHI
jgi:hypothetical protein